MVGLDNPLHIALLLVVVLVVFGAKRLPEMGKSLGEGLRGFKDSMSGEAPRSELTAASVSTPEPGQTIAEQPELAEAEALPRERQAEPVA